MNDDEDLSDTDPPAPDPEELTATDNPRPASESHDAEMLRMLHAMVADLCIEMGDNPNDVPCDVWRLAEHLQRLRADNRILAEMWDRMGRNARAGFEDDELLAVDHARDRAIYPGRHMLVTPETAERIGRQVHEDFQKSRAEVERVGKELDDWSEKKARGLV